MYVFNRYDFSAPLRRTDGGDILDESGNEDEGMCCPSNSL